ncbi:hypothetical protein AMTRI_Chr13g83740 [Amborella trichopoda]
MAGTQFHFMPQGKLAPMSTTEASSSSFDLDGSLKLSPNSQKTGKFRCNSAYLFSSLSKSVYDDNVFYDVFMLKGLIGVKYNEGLASISLDLRSNDAGFDEFLSEHRWNEHDKNGIGEQ